MKYRTLRFFFPALAVAVMMSSCQIEEFDSPQPESNAEDIIPATVSLKFNISGEDYGTPETKAIDDPGTVGNTQIQTLVILQYGGTEDDAPLVGGVHYLSADVTDPEDEHYLGDMEQIKLADSQGQVHTLVFLTNTFTEIRAGETLGEMLRLTRVAPGEADVFGHTGDGNGFPEETTYYQRMNALAVTEVTNDMTVYAILRRSMARINVQITNTGADGLQIRKVWLRNVSQKDYYITDYSYLSPDDHSTVELLRDYAFQDEYVSSLPLRTDYSEREWNGTDDGTGTAVYRWYVPSNMRGTDESNSLPSEKNTSINSIGATYVYILGEYGPEHDQAIIYRFYLGENLVNNFDLKPNTSYSYHFTFNGKGVTSTDKRIEDGGRKDFMVDANCYILNPPTLADLPPRKYTINVVSRPNIFWGTRPDSDRYGNFEEYPNNYIQGGEVWKARILWSDINYDQLSVLTKATDTNDMNATYDSMTQRIELTVSSNTPKGNLVIGVWTDDPTNILWSWHIWITDYEPDGIGVAPVEDRYVYPVKGGELHRYMKDAIWTTGELKNGYIMDRYLGALDQKSHSASSTSATRGGGFLYQFGRKDPFPLDYIVYYYNYNESAPFKSVGGGNNIDKVSYENASVPFSVNKPASYITGTTSWYSGVYASATNWKDPYPSLRTDVEETIVKSFFDPCPPGWKIAAVDTYYGFVYGNTSTNNPAANLITGAESTNGHNRGSGGTFYPRGYLSDKNSLETAFFPSTPIRMGTAGNVAPEGYPYWCRYGNSTSGSSFFFSTYISYRGGPNGPYGHANGFPVRCVRE